MITQQYVGFVNKTSLRWEAWSKDLRMWGVNQLGVLMTVVRCEGYSSSLFILFHNQEYWLEPFIDITSSYYCPTKKRCENILKSQDVWTSPDCWFSIYLKTPPSGNIWLRVECVGRHSMCITTFFWEINLQSCRGSRYQHNSLEFVAGCDVGGVCAPSINCFVFSACQEQ